VRATRAAKPSGSGRRDDTECSGFFIVRNARKATTKCLRSCLTRSAVIGTTALSFLGTITGTLWSSASAIPARLVMADGSNDRQHVVRELIGSGTVDRMRPAHVLRRSRISAIYSRSSEVPLSAHSALIGERGTSVCAVHRIKAAMPPGMRIPPRIDIDRRRRIG
jgi:hypothetical protein